MPPLTIAFICVSALLLVIGCTMIGSATRAGICTLCGGMLLALIGFAASPIQQIDKKVADTAQAERPAEISENALASKQMEVRTLGGQVEDFQKKLTGDYERLTAQQKMLGNDPEALKAFNQQAAVYNAAKDQLATMRTRLQQLLVQETQMTEAVFAEARKHAKNGGADEIVMYTTQRCPACMAAKSYFQQKGVAYKEIDVEASQQAYQEFQSLGGHGVPLILVKGQRMEGFNPQELDRLL
jgi:glutaredoxin